MSSPTIEIPLTAPVNLRDLGGIAIAGGVLREGFAIRADDLSLITEEDARGLVERGVAGVIDLRSADEVAVTGRGPLGGHPIAYHHLSLTSGLAAEVAKGRRIPMDRVSIGELYVRMVERAAPQLTSALAIIALAPGTTAFHCAGGLDRTGVLAASLLLALGADDEDVVADYGRSEANVPAVMARIGPVAGLLRARSGADPDAAEGPVEELPWELAMRTMIARLRERHDDPLAPLRSAGLTDQIIARLRQRALAA